MDSPLSPSSVLINTLFGPYLTISPSIIAVSYVNLKRSALYISMTAHTILHMAFPNVGVKIPDVRMVDRVPACNPRQERPGIFRIRMKIQPVNNDSSLQSDSG